MSAAARARPLPSGPPRCRARTVHYATSLGYLRLGDLTPALVALPRADLVFRVFLHRHRHLVPALRRDAAGHILQHVTRAEIVEHRLEDLADGIVGSQLK